MSLPSCSPSGDGQSGRPLPPGQLVVTDVTAADDLARGPALPLVLERVPAGFPSPADDYVEGTLDLHELTGAGRPSCFFLRVSGESMVGAGIHDGDVLVVDRAAEPVSGAVVVAAVDGELTVKRFVRRGGRVALLAANPEYPPIEVGGEQELVVWGVVTHSLRDHRPGRP
jgi:DNA polymerase V